MCDVNILSNNKKNMGNYYKNLEQNLIASGIPFEEAGWVHLFETENEFNVEYHEKYHEPWVGLTEELSATSYNRRGPVPYEEKPLTFKILTGGTIIWYCERSSEETIERDSREIQYRINDGVWTKIRSHYSSYSAPKIEVVAGDVVEFKGDNRNYADTEAYAVHMSEYYRNSFSGSTAKFEVEGNIMSLIDSTGYWGLKSFTSSHVFINLFSNCTGLTSARNLVLPVTSLTEYCYWGLFENCGSLTTVPNLPATTLDDDCYEKMFDGCASLTGVPSNYLPATTLAVACYADMFVGCTSLTTVPELPATTLTNRCYADMFDGCTSLTTVPELPATALASSCYVGMFSYCTSLTTVPSNYLPATTLADSCYSSMFNGCTALTAAPELPATALTNTRWCYSNMFKGCTSLTTAPELPATTLADYCYECMFESCTTLTTAPELPATTLALGCYQYMFQNCRNLNYIKCLATNRSASLCTNGWVNAVQTNSGTFIKNPNMTSWPRGNSGIPNNWTVQDAT